METNLTSGRSSGIMTPHYQHNDHISSISNINIKVKNKDSLASSKSSLHIQKQMTLNFRKISDQSSQKQRKNHNIVIPYGGESMNLQTSFQAKNSTRRQDNTLNSLDKTQGIGGVGQRNLPLNSYDLNASSNEKMVDGGIQCDFGQPSFQMRQNFPFKSGVSSEMVTPQTSQSIIMLFLQYFIGQQITMRENLESLKKIENKIIRQQTNKMEDQIVMMLREGDWVYNVTGNDLNYFKSLKNKADVYEQKIVKMPDKIKHQNIAKHMNMLNPNVRPKSAGLISKKNECKKVVKNVNRELMNQFFSYLKFKKRGIFTHQSNFQISQEQKENEQLEQNKMAQQKTTTYTVFRKLSNNNELQQGERKTLQSMLSLDGKLHSLNDDQFKSSFSKAHFINDSYNLRPIQAYSQQQSNRNTKQEIDQKVFNYSTKSVKEQIYSGELKQQSNEISSPQSKYQRLKLLEQMQKPLWIVSTTKRPSSQSMLNQKSSMAKDQHKFQHPQRKNIDLNMKPSQIEQDLSLSPTSSPDHLRSILEENKAIRIQQYFIDENINKDAQQSRFGSLKKKNPRFSNSQIKKYIVKDSSEQLITDMKKNKKRRFKKNHSSLENSLKHETPLFTNDFQQTLQKPSQDSENIEQFQPNSLSQKDDTDDIDYIQKQKTSLDMEQSSQNILVSDSQHLKKNILISKKQAIESKSGSTVVYNDQSDNAVDLLLEHIREETGESIEEDSNTSSLQLNFRQLASSNQYEDIILKKNHVQSKFKQIQVIGSKKKKRNTQKLYSLSEQAEEEEEQMKLYQYKSIVYDGTFNQEQTPLRRVDKRSQTMNILSKQSSKKKKTKLKSNYKNFNEDLIQFTNQKMNKEYLKNSFSPIHSTFQQQRQSQDCRSPTVKVISKYGGQQTQNGSKDLAADQESHSSYNEQVGFKTSLLQENDGNSFLEIPRYSAGEHMNTRLRYGESNEEGLISRQSLTNPVFDQIQEQNIVIKYISPQNSKRQEQNNSDMGTGGNFKSKVINRFKERSGINLANMYEFVPEISKSQLSVFQKFPELKKEDGKSTYNAYLKSDQQKKQDIRQAQMIKRNISVYRKRKSLLLQNDYMPDNQNKTQSKIQEKGISRPVSVSSSANMSTIMNIRARNSETGSPLLLKKDESRYLINNFNIGEGMIFRELSRPDSYASKRQLVSRTSKNSPLTSKVGSTEYNGMNFKDMLMDGTKDQNLSQEFIGSEHQLRKDSSTQLNYDLSRQLYQQAQQNNSRLNIDHSFKSHLLIDDISLNRTSMNQWQNKIGIFKRSPIMSQRDNASQMFVMGNEITKSQKVSDHIITQGQLSASNKNSTHIFQRKRYQNRKQSISQTSQQTLSQSTCLQKSQAQSMLTSVADLKLSGSQVKPFSRPESKRSQNNSKLHF